MISLDDCFLGLMISTDRYLNRDIYNPQPTHNQPKCRGASAISGTGDWASHDPTMDPQQVVIGSNNGASLVAILVFDGFQWW